jgi:hypothetical protein
MIKKNLKPIIIDKSKHLIDLNNWVYKESSFNYLDYDYESEYHLYEDEWATFYIEGIGDIDVMFEVEHSWNSLCDEGDYDTPPSYEIVSEEVDVYILSLEPHEGEINLEENVLDDLMYRLSYYIHDNLVTS